MQSNEIDIENCFVWFMKLESHSPHSIIRVDRKLDVKFEGMRTISIYQNVVVHSRMTKKLRE